MLVKGVMGCFSRGTAESTSDRRVLTADGRGELRLPDGEATSIDVTRPTMTGNGAPSRHHDVTAGRLHNDAAYGLTEAVAADGRTPIAFPKGWSQERYADEAGIHRPSVSDIERSARNPTIAVVEKLAKPFGVSPGQMLD